MMNNLKTFSVLMFVSMSINAHEIGFIDLGPPYGELMYVFGENLSEIHEAIADITDIKNPFNSSENKHFWSDNTNSLSPAVKAEMNKRRIKFCATLFEDSTLVINRRDWDAEKQSYSKFSISATKIGE